MRNGSVVVVLTKIARSRVLGACACCKHKQSIDIGGKTGLYALRIFSKRLTSAINSAFSVQHACGLLTTSTFCIIATAHAQARCWKGSSLHETATCIYASDSYSGYRVHGVYALRSSMWISRSKNPRMKLH